ncbi:MULTISPECIES: fused MFS/spermidine synthase [unclassified Paenibacillus]|uniref:spermidine synthase n=1 Tax=unclassified Paenibacillus TaxID=185978 RepID=UPI00095424F3|nr:MULTISPECIES: fused MFS/spermidine synthase [unclassified Paenibacillus]ASS69059.1 spermidine synthase [Paenibacillus sp. RUD330]SIR04006.1 Spermine/spermidine synthase [Paenibacillus sp. RU4X]SIR31236.1 Spermine/spermidine synthase [Paenibacillus sp. RU4T]
MRLLARERSEHQELSVYETSSLYGRIGRFRILQFSDSLIQGALDLKDPSRIPLEYPRALMALMDRSGRGPERAFLIGHGIGTIARHYPAGCFTVAELDSAVLELSRRYFGYGLDNVLVGDGRELLEKQGDGEFDFIVVDAFGSDGVPAALGTVEFFALCRRRLRPDGAVLLNLAGQGGRDKRITAVHAALRHSFPCTEAYMLIDGRAGEVRNVIVAGSAAALEAGGLDRYGFRRIEVEEGHPARDRRGGKAAGKQPQ